MLHASFSGVTRFIPYSIHVVLNILLAPSGNIIASKALQFQPSRPSRFKRLPYSVLFPQHSPNPVAIHAHASTDRRSHLSPEDVLTLASKH